MASDETLPTSTEPTTTTTPETSEMAAAVAQNPEVQWSLASKVVSYPSVSHTVESVSSLYNSTKGYNSLTAGVAGVVEGVTGRVATAATPIVKKLEPQLQAVDKYATETLVSLEQKAPIITEEPQEIYKSMVDSTVDSINKSYASKAVSSALQPVLSAAESRLVTAPGEEGATNGAEHAEEQEKGESNASSPQRTSPTPPPEDLSLQQTFNRVVDISGKIQRKALDKALEQVQAISKRSLDAMSVMCETVDLIQYAKSLEAAAQPGVDKVRSIISELVKDDEVDDDAEFEGLDEEARQAKRARLASNRFERRTMVLARNLTRQMSVGASTLVQYGSGRMPAKVQDQLMNVEKLVANMQANFEQAVGFRDLSDVFLEQTKTNIVTVSQTIKEFSLETAEYLVTSRPVAWILPKDNKLLSEIRRHSTDTSISTSSYAPSDSLDDVNTLMTSSEEPRVVEVTEQIPAAAAAAGESETE